jgi:hypothetical protein
MDIDGGADRRGADLEREIEGNVQFYFGVILRHMPVRVGLLLPSYPLVIYGRAIGWILDDRGHEPLAVRLRALADLTVRFPQLFGRSLRKVIQRRAWQPKARVGALPE